jgi:hypothetical protein
MPLNEKKIPALLAEITQLLLQPHPNFAEIAQHLDQIFSQSTLNQRKSFAGQLLVNTPLDSFCHLTSAVLKAELRRLNNNKVLRYNSLAQTLLISLAKPTFIDAPLRELLNAVLSPLADLPSLQLTLRDSLVTQDPNMPFIVESFQLIKTHYTAELGMQNADVQVARSMLFEVIQRTLARIVKTHAHTKSLPELIPPILKLSHILLQDQYLVTTTCWLINHRKGPEPALKHFRPVSSRLPPHILGIEPEEIRAILLQSL